MKLEDLNEECRAMLERPLARLQPGKSVGPFVCANKFYTAALDADGAIAITEVPMPVVGGVAGVVKTCGGCGGQNTQRAARVGNVDLAEYFDAVYLLNLPRRTDRLVEMRAHLAEIAWPFRQPELFAAVDARVCPPPPWWPVGHEGAWGCMESHRHMLANALSRGAKRVLILEDDFFAAANFASAAGDFVRSVPADWEMLYFGGQDVGRDGSRYREEISPGVFHVAGIERTHAYAVQGEMIRDLYSKLITSSGHCDHVMGPFQKGRKVYAPGEWLAGQRASKSDIGVESTERLWQPPPKDWPVTLFIGSADGAKKFREKHGLHGGHNLKGEIDIGILDVMRVPMADARKRALADWVTMIEWEGRSKTPPRPAFIYGVPESLARKAVGDRLQVASDMPGLATSAKNATKAIGRIIAAAVTGGDVQVLDAQRTDRLALCNTCDKLAGGRCVECTCFVEEKTRFATEDCPIGKWNLPVSVFYHVAAMNHWREVATEQLTALNAAGLDAATVTFVGKKDDRRWFEAEAKRIGVAIDITKANPNVMHYETFAMEEMERGARKNNGAFLYLHTKGVSAPGHRGKAKWRELMMREVVAEWRRNLESLRSADAVGCNWRDCSTPHFCGNFWMARTDYLRTLEPFAEYHAKLKRVRHSCEFWIGTGHKPRIVSLAHRNVDYCAPEYFG